MDEDAKLQSEKIAREYIYTYISPSLKVLLFKTESTGIPCVGVLKIFLNEVPKVIRLEGKSGSLVAQSIQVDSTLGPRVPRASVGLIRPSISARLAS